MADLTDSPAGATPPSRPLPFREDCWSEDATSTLVDSWGRRYLELNRGNLRQKDWQEVADAVNARHAYSKKTQRTDVQCKNRIDTLKKKYKVEKSKLSDSSWPFFARLDSLIGPTKTTTLALPAPVNRKQTPVFVPQKRSSPVVDDSYFRRNYSAMAAAAAAASDVEVSEDEDKDDEEEIGMSDESGREEGDGMRKLAKAIEKFAETYERVEGEKQMQLIELEKQRMQFAKDLEVQRMQLFMDTQLQLQKIKRTKRSGSDDIYS